MLPADVTISAVFCDDATGEVVLEVNHPESIDADMVIDTAQATGWIAHTLRSPHIQSSSMNMIHSTQKSSAKERNIFLQSLGKRVFRPPLVLESTDSNLNFIDQSNEKKSEFGDFKSKIRNKEEIAIFCLGGVKQVGRSCFIVVTSESKIMLDCGINPGEPLGISAYPRIDWFNFDLDEIDAVIISHAHIDHQGFLPALFKFGYRGPVYCTEPTLPLMTLLQYDSVKISKSNGTFLPYETRDVNVFGTHNILYSGDYKYARTQLLDSAVSTYPRVETLITESTYGNSIDIMPDQSVVYKTFTDAINKTLSSGGKVLIPVPAVGRAQEIMLVLGKEMREGRLMEAPVFIEGMISEASAIHMAYAHYLGFDVRKSVSNGVNPFQSEYFTAINGYERREEVFNDENPSVIMATSGMLEGGPSVEYFKKIAPDKKNNIIFVSYQINGTLGRRVIDGGLMEISMLDEKGKVKVIPIKCGSQKIDGFSGHSDFNQIMNFTARIKPKRVLVNHGEKSKSENVASNIFSRFKIRSIVPDNREIIKLR
jgi:predicted metal-dependent RNase